MPEDKDLQERQGVDAEKPEDGSSADIDDILSEIEIEDPESSPGQDSSSQLQEEPQHEASESGEELEIEEEREKEAPTEEKEEGSEVPDDTPGDKALEDAFDSALSEDELGTRVGILKTFPSSRNWRNRRRRRRAPAERRKQRRLYSRMLARAVRQLQAMNPLLRNLGAPPAPMTP